MYDMAHMTSMNEVQRIPHSRYIQGFPFIVIAAGNLGLADHAYHSINYYFYYRENG